MKEVQYSILDDVEDRCGRSLLGKMVNESWNNDPKRTLFTLSRYKFVARMLEGKGRVLEVGCADAFGSRIVKQFVKSLTVLDFDEDFIRDVEIRQSSDWPMNTVCCDFFEFRSNSRFDGIYALDVLEHIEPEFEDKFFSSLLANLDSSGVVVLGMPSLHSQVYASPQSKAGHVNCKSGEDFKATCLLYFSNVLTFGMNDEVLHTGFYPMCHYLFCICLGPKFGES